MTDQNHFQDSVLVDYLAGELNAATASAVESHVAECSDCASALTQHAQIETALYEAVATMPAHRPRVAWRRFAPAVAGVVSMAAALVLAFGSPARWIEFEGDGKQAVVGLSLGSTPPAAELTEVGCIEQSTPEGVACADPLTVALATFPGEGSWDTFNPDDGSDLNWCAADEDDALVCSPTDGRSG